MISDYYKRVKENVELRFSDILRSAELIRGTAGRIRKLRLYLIDNTFVDIWYAPDGSYSYQWEQRHVRNVIYRHDNAPHKRWETVTTFPHHFHNGSELNVTESYLNRLPAEAIQQFLAFARDKLTTPTGNQ